MRYWYILIFTVIAGMVWAQESTVVQKKASVKSAVESLSRSLEEDEPNETVALNYMNVGKAFAEQGEYTKAEGYLINARDIYLKLNKSEQAAIVSRELAKVQEAQKKLTEAVTNFEGAVKLSKDSNFRELNRNDFQRLQNVSNPASQAVYIQRNIDLTNQTANKDEQATAFQQMAEVNMVMDNKEEALSNLQQAMEVVQDKPLETAKLQREMANVYVADNQLEKAAASLLQAYELAIEEGHTIEAKNTLEQLVSQYKRENKNKQALDMYADFIARLEPMVRADSTLIDSRFFEVHETRIAQLEKERVLKDELIHKQNIINTVLIISIILVLFFLLFSIKAWYSINQRNKKIALQSLRREMNPHFLFNSLNSVNQFIAQNNELEANRYLSSYSKLMRTMMESSNKDFIPLSTEIGQLREYLELEHMRFKEKFTYQIHIDESLDTDSISIPGMLIQPQLENAIWHGLRYKEGDGLLTLTIKQVDENLCVFIEDNGIGIKQSQELKTKHQKEHHSRGLTNTKERLSLLNSLYHSKISMSITDKTGEETGVIVSLCFPLKYKS